MPDIGERRLATIRRVSKIEPIPGADRIVKATIDGWELVTQKGNYEVGDLVLYFELDSFLPVREEFEFLRKGCFKSTTNLGDGFRIKTIKLKGQVSQGLSLPLSDFFEKDETGYYYIRAETEEERAMLESRQWVDPVPVYLEEGMDVTEYFGVQKYEKPLPGPGGSKLGPVHARGNFPSFLQKTDQERAQNCLAGVLKWIYYGEPTVTEVTDERLRYGLETGVVENKGDSVYFKSGDQWFHKHWLRNDEETIAQRQRFEVTLKMDGSSVTVYHNEYGYGVCSRNFDLKRDPDSLFWKVASPLIPDLVFAEKNVAVQGELMGPGVQGNREGLIHNDLFIFDIYDIDQKRYMTPEERYEFLSRLGDSYGEVPMVDPEFVLTEETTVQDLAEPFAMSLPAISKHLKVLERAGLISRSREAQWRPCRIELNALKGVDDWLENYRNLWNERLDRLDVYLQELQAKQATEKKRERKK